MSTKSRQIGLYIGEALSAKVKEKCNEDGRKISEVIRSLLRLWIKGKVDIA